MQQMLQLRGLLVATACALALAGCDDRAATPADGAPSPSEGGEEGGEGGGPGGGPSTSPGGAGPGDPPGPGGPGDPIDPGGATDDPVSASCRDGQWDEELPIPGLSLSDASAAFDPSDPVPLVLAALEVRYPTGARIVEGGLANPLGGGKSCVTAFLSDTSSPDAILRRLSTLVHECGHFFDLGLGGFSTAAYWITEEVEHRCQGGSIPAFGGQTFSRSLINDDDYAILHSPCETWFGGGDCDSYAPVYLSGDPTDDQFDSGDQGFDMLFEELVQYVNSLATGYAFADRYQGSVSERDGLLTFLWYLERYLRLARLEHPQAYLLLRDTPCWRRAILDVWGRAWLYLDVTEDDPRLGIDDAFLLQLVRDPELLTEIDRLREAEGCAR